MTLKTIQRGDTLTKLVNAYNREHGAKLTVDQVAKANGLKDANKIQAGRQLLFPDAFEKSAKQEVIRNGDGKSMVRNGVNETVNSQSTPDLVTTSDAQVSSNITPRPLEKLPEAPVAPTDTKVSSNVTPRPVTTDDTKVSTAITPRPLEKLPPAPVTTTDANVSNTVTPRPTEKLPPPAFRTSPAVTTTDAKVSSNVTPRPLEKQPPRPMLTQAQQQSLNPQQTTQTTQVQKPQPSEPTWAPLPPGFKEKGGHDATMREALEQGFKKGGYAQGMRWLQEMEGLKIDGKFGPETEKAMKEYPQLVQSMRQQRIAETKGRTAMAPLSPSAMKALQSEMTKAYDAELAKSDNYDAAMSKAVQVLQRKLALANEPLVIDGQMGIAKGTAEKTQTYESMVRVFGKKQADALVTFTYGVSSRGVD